MSYFPFPVIFINKSQNQTMHMEGPPYVISQFPEGNLSCVNNPHDNLLHTTEEIDIQVKVLSVLSEHQEVSVLTAVLYGIAFVISGWIILLQTSENQVGFWSFIFFRGSAHAFLKPFNYFILWTLSDRHKWGIYGIFCFAWVQPRQNCEVSVQFAITPSTFLLPFKALSGLSPFHSESFRWFSSHKIKIQ